MSDRLACPFAMVRARAAFAVAAVAMLVVGVGCGGTVPTLEGPAGSAEADYLKGERAEAQGRHLQAVEALERFRTEHPGSDRIDDAIFLLGKAHQGLGDHLLARDEFDRLLRDFPQSDHREEAQFERAISWMAESRGPALDPQPTEEALEAFRAYLRIYPDGKHREAAQAGLDKLLDRLAVKAYLNGRTYHRSKRAEAARIYYEKSLEILPESSKAAETLLGLAQITESGADADSARAGYERVLAFVTPERAQAHKDWRRVRQEAEAALARLARPGESSSGRP